MSARAIKILIVDDSPEDRATYRRFLSKDSEHEYVFLEAETGEEGLEACRNTEPDCILLDYLLPDLDGLEFLLELTDIKSDALVPVVMATGQGSESVAAEAIKHGAQDYMVKGNITAEAIYRAVHNAIQRVSLYTKIQEQQNELARAEQKANRANAAKSDFLASMSHEIRTPMNSIIGFSEILLGEALPDEWRQHVGTIHRNAVNLLALINDVLDLSKVEAGRMDVFESSFSVGNLIHSVAAMLRVGAQEHKAEIAVELDPALPENVQGDEQKLRQVLVNLVGNAVKFTPGGRVLIRTEWRDEMLQVDVIDDGVGIAAEKLEAIFEPFTQAGGATRQSGTGTGLGLALVRRFVGLMSGEVHCSSVEGEGSTFTFTVPVRPGTKREAEPEQLSPADVSALNVESTRLVVVAEDNADNRLYLRTVLEAQNFTVLFAENGEEAVRKAELKPDIILMDMQMPIKNGYEATAEIKRNPELASIPIVALTAYAMPQERQRAFTAGVDGYVTKPVSKDTLMAEIVRLLGASFSATQPVEEKPAPAKSGAQDIVRQYVATFRKKLADFERMLASGDLEGLRYLGHGLKGSGTTYGFEAISSIGKTIEEAAEAGDADALEKLGRRLQGVLDAAARSVAEEASRAPAS
jgi:signal transduction histidine kinase/HPt (histidine-containing phosphotransfer) domain-containing protein